MSIDKLSIGAFRNLEAIELENLGRINLLVGSNNAGKTSILEALAVVNHPFDPYEWFNVVRAREIRSVGYMPDQMSLIESIRWMFPASHDDVWENTVPRPIEISTVIGSAINSLRISCEPIEGFIDPEQFRRINGFRSVPDSPVEDVGLHIFSTANLEQGFLLPESFSQDWTIWAQLGMRSINRRIRPHENVQFLAPYAHRNTPANLRLLSESSRLGSRDDVDALLRTLDSRISGVEIITSADGRYPKLAIRTRNGSLMPQGVFGDGTRRALSIALAIRAAANGILLIDEIEAALHVEALDRIYSWMADAVESFNVQVFATTHSLEAIEAITKSSGPSSLESLSAYALDAREDGGAKRYTGGMLHRLVRQRGLDIRL